MTRLNQIIAVEKGVKNTTDRDLTSSYHTLQRVEGLQGISKTYRAKDEDGDKLPGESKHVQVNVNTVLADVAKTLTRLFDVVLTKDSGNMDAKADIKVGGTVIATQVPVTYLLWLEKKLVDIHTIVQKLPTLDPAEEWAHDSNTGVFKTSVITTTRTKKIPRNHVKAPATDKHPAQVEMFHEDVLVGYWDTVKFSGALPEERRRVLIERVQKLQEAVKYAREEANSKEITDRKIGAALFDYLLAS